MDQRIPFEFQTMKIFETSSSLNMTAKYGNEHPFRRSDTKQKYYVSRTLTRKNFGYSGRVARIRQPSTQYAALTVRERRWIFQAVFQSGMKHRRLEKIPLKETICIYIFKQGMSATTSVIFKINNDLSFSRKIRKAGTEKL